MRLLLIQVPTSHLGAGERVYPLGLARLAAVVPAEIAVRGLDLNLAPDPWLILNETLLKFRPDVVALSFRNLDPLAGHHASYLSSLKTAAYVTRKLMPKVKMIAGGPAFSLFARRLMEEVPELDIGVVGEAESIFAKLLQKDFSMQTIPGVIWRKDGCIRQNPPAKNIDLDTLPAPATGIFQPQDYLKGNKYVAAMGIEGKRGCNLNCAYCVYPYLGGRKMRLRSPVKIVDEMEMFVKEHGVGLFHFTDGVLNRPEDHFQALCIELIKRKLNVGWTGFFREDNLTLQLTELAMRAGLSAIYFSGDALTDHGLKLLNKQLSKDHLFDAAKITSKCGILTMCHFLVNLPQEDESKAEEAFQTLDQLLEIHAPAGNLGAVIFNTVRLYPNAPLTRRLLNTGELDSQFDLLYPVYYNPLKSSHRLHQLESRCHLAGVLSRLAISSHLKGY